MFLDTSLSKTYFLGDNASSFELEQECVVCPYHLGVLVVLHGLDEDGIAVDFHHNHDALVATKRLDGELVCLVGEHGFAYHVCLGVRIQHLLAMEVGDVACFPKVPPQLWWTVSSLLFGSGAHLQF
jgi:hypothetical protein